MVDTARTKTEIMNLLADNTSGQIEPQDLRDAFESFYARTAVSVREYGATGNGTANDYTSINNAFTAVRNAGGGTLFFPRGTYRITTTNIDAPVIFPSGTQNIAIVFEPGAELLIDNAVAGNFLGPSGDASGFLLPGSCKNIIFLNVNIRWAAVNSERGGGGGISIINPAAQFSTGATIAATANERIWILNCQVYNCPGVMLRIDGSREVWVDNFYGYDSLADGLYIRRSQNVHFTNCTVRNAGDDGISFGRYCSYPNDDLFDHDWCCVGCSATNIVVDGQGTGPGSADASRGILLCAARNVTVSNLVIRNKGRGIGVEAGYNPDWSFLACHDYIVENVVIENAYVLGIWVDTWSDVGTAAPAKWWKHQVTIRNVEIRNASQWIEISDSINGTGWASGITFQNIRALSSYADPGFSELSRVQDMVFDNIQWDQRLLISNGDGAVADPNTLTEARVILRNFNGPHLALNGLRKFVVDGLHLKNAPLNPLEIRGCTDGNIGSIDILHPSRSADVNYGEIWITNCQRLSIGRVFVRHDTTAWRGALLVEAPVSHLVIDRTEVITDMNSTSNHLVAGQTLFTSSVYRALNRGETTPNWRYATNRVEWATAAPTTRNWLRGDVVWNSNAATGQPRGWLCTVAGTPGTWVSMGAL